MTSLDSHPLAWELIGRVLSALVALGFLPTG